LVRAPNLAVLSRDDCQPRLHAVLMLSLGKIDELEDGEAAECWQVLYNNLKTHVIIKENACQHVVFESGKGAVC